LNGKKERVKDSFVQDKAISVVNERTTPLSQPIKPPHAQNLLPSQSPQQLSVSTSLKHSKPVKLSSESTATAKMCKYCTFSIFTPTDISDLVKAAAAAREKYPDRSLAQQLALVATEFEQIWEPKGEMGLPENWDWRKLAQVLMEHGAIREVPLFKGR
jgi:hypothetical protein